jgi:hypothetical protein
MRIEPVKTSESLLESGNDFFFHDSTAANGCGLAEISRSHSDTLILGIIPPDEVSVLNRDFYLTTHNTHNRHTSKSA